jgi:hypothetical protein
LPVALDALLDHPDLYDGKLIRVSGFLNNQHEDQGVYRTANDAKHIHLDGSRLARCHSTQTLPPMKAVWWELPPGLLANDLKCDAAEATVEGVYDACQAGHMDIFAGGVMNVSYVGVR